MIFLIVIACILGYLMMGSIVLYVHEKLGRPLESDKGSWTDGAQAAVFFFWPVVLFMGAVFCIIMVTAILCIGIAWAAKGIVKFPTWLIHHNDRKTNAS